MATDIEAITTELVPLNRIRVETALSRFPIHRLSKKGSVAIDFTSDTDLQWKVTYNSEYGEPGPHAYKIDTLIVNRRLDEASRPLPEIIRLGTLREINRELGLAEDDTQTVKRALLQNASAFISAKIRFKPKGARDGQERWREIHYSRYSVVFTGDPLPDGNLADAVYIVLNPPHRKTLNDAEVRPLDYDYLTSLSPGSQRLYELLSFQIFGAVASGRSRARLVYSEYCQCAPQVRYENFDAVKKQMFKLHMAHRESGYITKVEYQQTEDLQGRIDWEMLYTPGPKALVEYESFSKRPARTTPSNISAPPLSALPTSSPAVPDLAAAEDTETALIGELAKRGIAPNKAHELLGALKPGQDICDQLAYVDHVIATAPEGKFRNPSGFYISFIEQNSPIPASFPAPSRQRVLKEARMTKQAELVRLDHMRKLYDDHCLAEVRRFFRDKLSADEYTELFEQRRAQTRRMLKKMPDAEVDALAHAGVQADIRTSGRISLPSFEDFRRLHSRESKSVPA